METLKGIINISKEDLEHYNRLLTDIDFNMVQGYADTKEDEEKMQKIIDELNAKEDDYIGIGYYDFGNGKSITFDIASGNSNYFDNVVMWAKEQEYNREYEVFDCDYEIGLNTFEWYDDEDDITYIIEWNII